MPAEEAKHVRSERVAPRNRAIEVENSELHYRHPRNCVARKCVISSASTSRNFVGPGRSVRQSGELPQNVVQDSAVAKVLPLLWSVDAHAGFELPGLAGVRCGR